MVRTNTDIANMALTYVGAMLISNIDDDRSPEAQLSRTFFEISRQAELEIFDWSFARRYQALATAPNASPDTRFPNAYILPQDCLSPRNIEPKLRRPYAYQVAQNEDGQRLILVDGRAPIPATLRYTFDQTDPSVFTTNFTLALSHRLASYIAYARTKKQTVRTAELLLAKEARQLAQASDGNAANEEPIPPIAEWHAVRGFNVEILGVDPSGSTIG